MPKLSDLPNFKPTDSSSAIKIPSTGILTTPSTPAKPEDFASKAMEGTWDDIKGFGYAALNTVLAPFNAGFDAFNQYTDINKWLDTTLTTTEKLTQDPTAHLRDALSRGWEKGGFSGAVNTLAQEAKTGPEFIANTSSALTYDALQQLYPEDQEKNRQFALEMRKNFREESPISYYGGGLAADVLAFDPVLAFLKFGSTAVKTAERVGLQTAKAEEKAVGLAGKSKTVDEALSNIRKTVGEEAANKAQASIANKVKEARRVADNAMISLQLPKIKPITLVNKPKFLQRTADTLGEQGVVAVGKLFPEANQSQIAELLQTRYGVNRADDLTIDMLRDLQKAVDDLPKPQMVEKVVEDIVETSTTKDIPFSLAKILKPYSQEVKDLAMGLVQKGATPEQIIAELPNLLRGKIAPVLDNVLPTFEVGQSKIFKGQPVKIIEADPKFPRTVKVQFADGSTSIAKKSDMTDLAPRTAPTTNVVDEVFSIPKELAGSKPRYGYKSKQFELQFDSDLDKALYIIAGKGKSKAHDKFVKLLSDHTGLSEAELIAEGLKVRNAIKELAKTSSEGQLKINKVSSLGAKQTQQVAEAMRTLPTPQELQQVKQFDQKTIDEINKLAKQVEESLPIKQVTRTVKKPVERIVKVQDPNYDPIGLLTQGEKFIQDAGGRSKLARSISAWWNSRKDGDVGSAFINEYGKLIRDANIRSLGELKYIQRDLAEMQDIAKTMTPLELKAVQYVVENSFPTTMADQMIKSLMSNTKVQQLADRTKSILSALGQEEKAAGLLDKLREDYFPHIMKFDETAWEKFKIKYADDPRISAFIGKGTAAGFMKERKGFDTLAELDDLIVYNRELAAKGDLMAAEKADDLEKIFNRDTLDALNARVKASTRARAYNDLYKQMEADGLIVTKGKGVPSYMLGDYIALDAKTANKLGVEPGGMIHKDILEAMNKVENKFTRKEMNKFFQMLNDSMRLWRLLTYQLLPKHHMNNLIGNLFNAGLGGMKLENLQEAQKLLLRVKNKTASAKDMEMVKQAYLDGVLGQGFRAEFESLNLNNQSIMSKIADRIEKTWYSQNILGLGEKIDDWTRLALYMHGLNRVGGTRKSASDLVRKYLFNYNEATDMDRKLRMVFPFWLWMKNNIPLQLKQFAKNPAYYATFEKIRQATYGQDDPLEQQKDYIREGYINIGGTKFKFNLPMYDLNMISGDLQKNLKTVAQSSNPFIQAAVELAQNKQLLTGAPIQKEMERRYNPQSEYDLGTLSAYLAKKFGGYPAWVVADIAKNLGEKGKLTSEEEIARLLQSYLIATPSLEK